MNKNKMYAVTDILAKTAMDEFKNRNTGVIKMGSKELNTLCDNIGELIPKLEILADTETDEKRKHTLEECLNNAYKIKDVADYLC